MACALSSSAAASFGKNSRSKRSGRTALLVLEHAFGMLGVGERAEGEEHDCQARPTETRREVRQELLDHEEADPGLNGTFDRIHARRHHQYDQDERECRVPVHRRHVLLLNAVEHAPDAGDRTGQSEDDDALPGRVDAETGRRRLAPSHRGQVAADRSLADQENDTTATASTTMARMNMAWPLKLKNALGAQPLRLQAGALGPASDPDVVEGGVVEEQRGRQGHERQAQPAQAQGQERQHDGDDGRHHGPDDRPDEEVEAEVDGEHGGGEGTDSGERRLAERQLSGHARDQRHREAG